MSHPEPAAPGINADVVGDVAWVTVSNPARHNALSIRMMDALDRLATPLVAMVHGHCLGAGLALALGADIRISGDGGRFAIPAARLGLAYPVPLVHALARAVGPGQAAEILFTARTLTAAEALRAGLVNRVVASGELEEVVRETAERIAANAPLSVRAAKTAIRSAADPALTRTAERLVEVCAESDDAREGRRAFTDKRPPRFTGR